MKTGEILEETIREISEISFDFNDLTALQIGALRAIKEDRLDFENASERMMDVVYELQDHNLIDTTLGLTPQGEKAVAFALSMGSAERRAAAAKAERLKNYDPDEDVYNDYDDQMDDDDWSDEEMNRFGGIQHNV